MTRVKAGFLGECWLSRLDEGTARKIANILALLTVLLYSAAWADECVDCHQKISPGIVADWKASRHAAINGGPKCATCHGELHNKADDAKRAASAARSRKTSSARASMPMPGWR